MSRRFNSSTLWICLWQTKRLHDSPALLIHWTEIWAVWRPQVGRKKVWRFLTQQFNCCTCAARCAVHCFQWRRAHWARSTLNTPSRVRSGLVRSGQVHILDTCLCCITCFRNQTLITSVIGIIIVYSAHLRIRRSRLILQWNGLVDVKYEGRTGI